MTKESRQRTGFVYAQALATLGPAWALKRAKLALLNKFGFIERRTPLQSWDDLTLSRLLKPGIPTQADEYSAWRRDSPARFLFAAPLPIEFTAGIGESSVDIANGILNGEFPYFGYMQRLGFPPDWQRSVKSDGGAPSGHWSKIDDFAFGDIKLQWEASRFSWVFPLGRAFARTGDKRYPEAFWQLLESWMERNPPNSGINWKCGQEASLRVMALCFALYVFSGASCSTSERTAQLVTLVGALGRRIDAYTEYALSQKNNHGISEGTGLWTIGLLFPELRSADRWKARGKDVIEFEVRRQIYNDGSYVQHSTNYHRVMLHDLAWAIRLGESNHQPLASDIYERFAQSTRFLHAITDPESGHAPNYGANDGAWILPLADCDFNDMRPVLQSCHSITTKNRLYPPGPWDEESMWLNGAAPSGAVNATAAQANQDLSAHSGGYYTLHSRSSWALFHGMRFKDRPSHADQLHFDLWWRGENVLCDAGTYSYNAAPPFDHAFASTRFHNTVTLDGLDQMTRLSRFLWSQWANATVHISESAHGNMSVLQGEHDGYLKRGAIHRRAVIQPDPDVWLVIDDLVGEGEHTARLHWLVPDVRIEAVSSSTYDLTLPAGASRIAIFSSGPSVCDVVKGGGRLVGESRSSLDQSRGWRSRYYGRMEPALSIETESRSVLPIRFLTIIMLGASLPVEVDASVTQIAVGPATITLSAIGEPSITARTLDRCIQS